MRRLFFILLLVASASGETEQVPSPFEPKAMALAPEQAPQIPIPEKFWGEPLPAPHEKTLLVKQALQLSAEQPAVAEDTARIAQISTLFQAVADGDSNKVLALLADGTDVNSVLPLPADPTFVERFRGTHMHYFVTVEHGLTPLMLAAGTGDAAMTRLLIDNGASPAARTKRHKTFALWLAGKGGHVEAMQILLGVTPKSDAAKLSIEVDLAAQTATLSRDGAATVAVPVSTGRKGFRTPEGNYVVTDKHRKWRSTRYPADMPFFMRLSCGEIGFHEGRLPGYPASHGCIRMRRKDAAEFFKQVPIGTKVVIK